MSGALESLAEKVEAQAAAIAELGGIVAALAEKIVPTREIFSLRDVAELPESPPLATLRSHPARQPNHGKPDGYRGREKCWRRETVSAWRRELSAAPAGGIGFAKGGKVA
jgi:hypothetical protein